MLKRRFAGAVTAALLAVMVVASACGGTTTGQTQSGQTGGNESEGGAPEQPQTVTIAQTTKPDGDFNPLVTQSNYVTDITALIFESLLQLTPDLGYEANMADYELKDNGLTLAFTLKPGIKFHDGNPLTTADVAATFYFIMDPDSPDPNQSLYSYLKGGQDYFATLTELKDQLNKKSISADEFEQKARAAYETWKQQGAIEVIDDTHINIHFDSIYAPALGLIGGTAILEKSQIDSMTPIAEAATAEASQHPIGTGPYQFVQYVDGQYTELKAFPDYFKGAPKVDTIIFKVLDQNTFVPAMQKGDVDAVGFGASQINPNDQPLIEQLGDNYGWELPQFGYQVMGLNMNQKRFQDVAVRQAMMYAIDRQGLIDQLMGGHGTVINAPFAPPSWAYPKSGLNEYPYDPDQAKKVLADAGWTDSNGDGVLDKDLNGDGKISADEQLAFTLEYPNDSNPIRQNSAPIIQDNLNAIGMKVTLSGVEFNKEVADTDNNPDNQPGNFDAFLIGWGLAVDPDTTGLFGKADEYNLTRWTPENVGQDIYDQSMKLTNDGLATFDQDARAQIYQQLAALYNQYLPYIFLYSQNNITDFNNRVQNVNQDIRGAMVDTYKWTATPR